MPERSEVNNGIDRKQILEDFEKEADPRNYFDFVKEAAYQELFKDTDLKGKRIIDLGVGFIPMSPEADTAKHLSALEEKGEIFIPIDARTMQARTWRLLPRHSKRDGSQIEPVVASAFDLPFKDNSIDGCFLINFTNSFGENAHDAVYYILQELHRVLKPGAFVVISNYGYFRRNTEDGQWLTNNDIEEKDIIGLESIEVMASELGFHDFKNLEFDKERAVEAAKQIAKEATFQGRSDLGNKVQLWAPVGITFFK